MDDFLKILVYVAAAVIYAIFNMRKKAKTEPKPKSVIPEAPKKPMPHTAPAKTYAEVPRKKAHPPLAESLKKIEDDIKKSKKKVKTERHIKSGKVFEEKSRYMTTIDKLETASSQFDVDVKDHFEKIQKFNEIQNYELNIDRNDLSFENLEEKKPKNKYSEFLKDPDNIKTAFIAKEIFDRKHF